MVPAAGASTSTPGLSESLLIACSDSQRDPHSVYFLIFYHVLILPLLPKCPNQVRPVEINFGCQIDSIWNHLRDQLLGTTLRLVLHWVI